MGMVNPAMDTSGEGSYWHSYLAVEDIDSCAKQTEDLGGKVLVPPHDVADVGRICAVAHIMQTVENK